MKSNYTSLFYLLLMVVGFATLSSLTSNAAVTGTKFYIHYNASNCNYEAHMIVTAGSAAAGANAGAVQFTIVVPHGTTVTKVADNEPHITSGSLGPQVWNFPQSRVNAPAISPGNDYISATLSLSPAAAYPALAVNTDLILFKFTANTTTCGNGIRMWNNNSEDGNADPLGSPDPFSFQSGMQGGDFNNSFTVSSPNETYTGRALLGTTTWPSPVFVTKSKVVTPPFNGPGGTIVGSVTYTAGACATPLALTYSWTGPNSFSSSSSSWIRPNVTANYGTYNVVVTNSNGCTATTDLSVPLAIKIISFHGNANKCVAQLNWQIAPGERDLQYFEVQYSSDGSRFVGVGQLERNDYNDTYTYNYTQPSGKGYYRLKIIDLQGKATYSETVPVSTTCDNGDIIIAPNPTSSLSTVSGIEAGDQVKVTDVLGNVIANYISGGTNATVDLGIYPAGIYSVIVSRNGDVLKAAKLTKQ